MKSEGEATKPVEYHGRITEPANVHELCPGEVRLIVPETLLELATKTEVMSKGESGRRSCAMMKAGQKLSLFCTLFLWIVTLDMAHNTSRWKKYGEIIDIALVSMAAEIEEVLAKK